MVNQKTFKFNFFYKLWQGQAHHVQDPHQPAVYFVTPAPIPGDIWEMEKEIFPLSQ